MKTAQISTSEKKVSNLSEPKYFLFVMFAGILLFFSASCTSLTSEERARSSLQDANYKPTLNVPDSPKIIKPIAEKYVEQMLQAINKNDYKMFSAYLTRQSRQRFTPQKFHDLVKGIGENLGKYHSKQFLAILRNGVSRVVIWKGIFDKADKKNKDVLISLLIAKLDNKYKVFAFGVR